MSKARSGDTGYTIVEVMIFLAISGALLLSAMLLIGGHQRSAEFSTSVQDFDSKLQSVIGNVASGYYNNNGQTFCGLDGSGNPDPHNSGGSQGTNPACTFIGQVITFAPNDDKVTIYSTVGLRRTGLPAKEVTTLAEAKPVLFNDTKEDYPLGAGMKIISVNKISDGTSVGSVGIFTTFNSYNTGLVPSLSSGSSRSDTYTFLSSNPTTAELAAASPTDSAVGICLSNGSSWGLITLNTGSTIVTIGDGGVCS